ncbi:MAG: hypothetical protein WCP98_04780 [Actinomycetes bacterium]
MALACGFGLNLERCDAEVLAAVMARLEQREKAAKREQLMAKARERLR